MPPTITHSEEWTLQVGDSIWISTDGFWGPLNTDSIAAQTVDADVVTLVPKLMEDAERKAGAESDNLSVVAMRWEKQEEQEADALAQNVTATEPVEGFTSSMNTTQQIAGIKDEISDDEIERAIAEIQNAIKKVSR
ncbi:MAG: hypothetical protein HC782_03180 [Gammaproteobacteria bacterium]|nr:hypothetical protein [Gammaproteobacteria bacterium]